MRFCGGELKRLFKEAFVSDDYSSAILYTATLLHRSTATYVSVINCFYMGSWRHYVYVQQAIAAAVDVEYALNFDTAAEDTQDINVVQFKHPIQDAPAIHKL